ncbi:MAG: hypothetical protein AAF360_15550, partial [Pseudomonadota bacterium]
EPETPPTETASLTPPSEESTIDAARGAAVEDLRAAAPAPTGTGATCAADVASSAAAGGASQITVISPCRAGEVFRLAHGPLTFDIRFDGDGEARMVLPVLSETDGVSASFEDGSTADAEVNVNWRELAKTRRVAVAWTDQVDLDLHAFEYAASYGAEGHVWEDQPRGFRLVKRSGGGYLDSFPALAAGGQSIEVYTFWTSRRAPRGITRIALDHASRGAQPEGDYCDDGALATPGYVVVQSIGGVAEAATRGRFSAARCGEVLDPEARYSAGALLDLEID